MDMLEFYQKQVDYFKNKLNRPLKKELKHKKTCREEVLENPDIFDIWYITYIFDEKTPPDVWEREINRLYSLIYTGPI